MSRVIYILLFSISIFMFSCNKEKNQKKDINWSEVNKKLIKINKYLVYEDSLRIVSYIDRQGWDMTETGMSFWYTITEHGTGDSVKKDDIVTLSYEIELLDGTQCYNSDSIGNLSFKVGMGGVISGLEHGVLLLREGDKAIFIFPPLLGYGLVGDDKKIPPRSILVYKIKVVGLEKKEE